MPTLHVIGDSHAFYVWPGLVPDQPIDTYEKIA